MGVLVSWFRRVRLQTPPAWGIEPVPEGQRVLRWYDLFALWFSLGVGLLVLQAGALLVPGLSFAGAMWAIVLGSVIGSLLLALTGLIGSDSGAPTMVLLRPVLGQRGSYLASVLNVAQLLGWTAFELWVIALTAGRISQSLFGAAHYSLWLVVGTIFCLLLALGGPLVYVRAWLEKFGIWVMLLASLWITVYLLGSGRLAHLLAQPGNGQLPFWAGVDLVVATPISWLPLVADYSRFARRAPGAFWGTFVGYGIANIWFYALGALFVLGLDLSQPSPDAVATAIVGMTGGLVALLVILVDETDNAFADIYSAAVSIQNIFPRLSQRWLIVGVTALGALMAAFLTMSGYAAFLILIGSVFVPLFGILAADFFIARRQVYPLHEIYGTGEPDAMGIAGPAAGWGGFQAPGLLAWVAGIVVYQAVSNDLPWLGASIPSFLVAFAAYLLLAQIMRVLRRATAT
jgi:putative hydroxymethylpyrimidine transporter CytX